MGDSPRPAYEVFVGVGIAKGKYYACAVSARGEALFLVRFPTTRWPSAEWSVTPRTMAVRRWWLI